MASQAEEPEPYFSSLVSLDSDTDAISTQFRLLLPSSKILILPPLLSAAQQPRQDFAFNARPFVRHIHELLSSRPETTRSFLQSSTRGQPRLVFMNGGYVSAVMTSITTICDNITNGEIRGAEELFEEIAKDSVAGFVRQDEDNALPVVKNVTGEAVLESWESEMLVTTDDPMTAAMKAADTLDRATASLQPAVGEEVGNMAMMDISQSATDTITQGSLNIAKIGEAHSMDEYVDVIPKDVHSRKASLEEKRKRFGLQLYTHSTSWLSYKDAFLHQTGAEKVDRGTLFPGLDQRDSAPSTPGLVEFGEASLIDVQSTNSTKIFSRATFVDNSSPESDRLPSTDVTPHALSQGAPAHCLRSSGDAPADNESYIRPENSSDFETLPRTTYVRPSETITKSSSILETSLSSDKHVLVDRGADNGDPVPAETLTTSPQRRVNFKKPEPSERVFAVVDNLAIHFSNGSNNEILEPVVRSCKSGRYPLAPTSEPISQPSPTTPTDSSSSYSIHFSTPSNITAETDDCGCHRRQEVDPYKTDGSCLQSRCLWPREEPSEKFSHIPSRVDPPTPATTPPPIPSQAGEKFHGFAPDNTFTAVGVQDSVREALNFPLPPESTGYSQHTFAVEGDHLWKPAFHKESHRDKGRTVDQIIALGCEDGVDKDFYNEISEHVEKLPIKGTHGSMTGKLDIRYLIINAMQTFTSQPLSIQAGQNPFSQPSVLATLLIPHLESYFSSNDSTRLLILHYPASHLSTVLALRDLLGPELLKVAGITNSHAISRPTRPTNMEQRKDSTTLGLYQFSGAASQSPSRVLEVCNTVNQTQEKDMLQASFSEADFLLSSRATDSEICTFMSSICKNFAEGPSFNALEASSSAADSQRTPSLTYEFPTPVDSYRPQSTPSRRRTPSSKPQKKSVNSVSTTGYATSTASTKNEPEENRTERQSEKDWETFYIADDEDEDEDEDDSEDEDEDEDEIDGVLTPRGPLQGERSGNSRKALKVLGLA